MRRLLVGAVLVLAACHGAVSEAAVVSLTEGRIDVSNSILAAGDTSLEVVNDGEFNHTLVVATADGRVVTATAVRHSRHQPKLLPRQVADLADRNDRRSDVGDPVGRQ